MSMGIGKACNEEFLWDEIIHDLDGHPLQLWGWGELKATHGWSAHRVLFTDVLAGFLAHGIKQALLAFA